MNGRIGANFEELLELSRSHVCAKATCRCRSRYIEQYTRNTVHYTACTACHCTIVSGCTALLYTPRLQDYITSQHSAISISPAPCSTSQICSMHAAQKTAITSNSKLTECRPIASIQHWTLVRDSQCNFVCAAGMSPRRSTGRTKTACACIWAGCATWGAVLFMDPVPGSWSA